jgi:hypothetical protein
VGGRQKEIARCFMVQSLITGPAALIHYSIRGGPATDVIDVLVPATPQRHSAGLARLLRPSPLPARAAGKRNGPYV